MSTQRDAIVETALALKELNGTGIIPHFHGVVMDERPMLVSDWHEVSLLQHLQRCMHAIPMHTA